MLSLISLCAPFPIVPSCWLNLDQGFIWNFLAPVCAIICVSEYVAPLLPTTEEAPGTLGPRQHKGHTFSQFYELIFPPATSSIPHARRWELCADTGHYFNFRST